jgi:hypothetical protein
LNEDDEKFKDLPERIYMRNQKYFFMVFGMIFGLFVAGCSFPRATSTTPSPNPELIYTLAAETVQAQLTQDVLLATDTPEPGAPEATQEIAATISATPTPSATQTPTQTLIPTLADEDPRVKLGNSTWKTTFKDDSTWYTFETDQTSFEIEDNTLVMTAKKSNSYENWSMAWPVLTDFYLEITGTTGDSCSGKDRYGLIFRAPDPEQGYLVGISCDGSFRIRTWDGENFEELRGWQSSEHILTGEDQTNRLGVMADGSDISVYINGHLVEEIQDDSYSKGSFGTFIASDNTPDFTVSVSEAAYWDLP